MACGQQKLDIPQRDALAQQFKRELSAALYSRHPSGMRVIGPPSWLAPRVEEIMNRYLDLDIFGKKGSNKLEVAKKQWNNVLAHIKNGCVSDVEDVVLY